MPRAIKKLNIPQHTLRLAKHNTPTKYPNRVDLIFRIITSAGSPEEKIATASAGVVPYALLIAPDPPPLPALFPPTTTLYKTDSKYITKRYHCSGSQETVYDSALRAAVYPYWMGALVSVFATPATCRESTTHNNQHGGTAAKNTGDQ